MNGIPGKIRKTLAGFLVLMALPAGMAQTLSLVSARDQIEGSFVTPQSVYADQRYVYLASAQGKLFILERSVARDFPLVATIDVSSAPLTAVRGDDQAIFVSSADGSLYVFSKVQPFPLLNTLTLSPFGLNALAVRQKQGGSDFLISHGQARLAANEQRVYLSELNEGEVGVRLDRNTFAILQEYGLKFESGTVVFDRVSGARIGAVPNPYDLLGRPAQVALYVDGQVLFQTTPGCCGRGVRVYDSSLRLVRFFNRPSTNTVALSGDKRWLVAGNENGTVDIFDWKSSTQLAASVNLRELMGYSGSEAVEIRSLWVEGNWIFAASSRGNDSNQSPSLPALFVLRIQ
jgi:hypothetical protein